MNCHFFTWETAIQIKGTLVSLSLFPFTSFHFLGIFLSLKKKKKKKERKIYPEKGEGGPWIIQQRVYSLPKFTISQFCCHKHVPVGVLTELPS